MYINIVGDLCAPDFATSHIINIDIIYWLLFNPGYGSDVCPRYRQLQYDVI